MSSAPNHSNQLTIYTQPRPFTILHPEYIPPRGIGIIVDPSCWVDATDAIIRSQDVVALDFETRGTDPTLPDNYIVGVGFAGDTFNYYFDRQADPEEFDYQMQRLLDCEVPLIAHNVTFDGSWLRANHGQHANWAACTYALYRKLATEGWTGQRWGLKDAMQDVLLWSDTNESGIDTWLVENGYANQSGNPMKGEMWRCPPEILGQYCLLDAEATYLLYTRVLRPAADRFPELTRFHREDFLHLIRILIDQRLIGIDVDRDGLLSARDQITAELGPMETWLRTESDIAQHVRQWEANKLAEFNEREPQRYRKQPKAGAEPAYLRKDGTVSKTWLNWHKKVTAPPVQSKAWEKWAEKRQAIEAGQVEAYRFNLRSGDHLRWLFFDAMGMEALEFTKKGLPKCDTDTMRAFGPGGEALEQFHLLHKELSFVTSYLELTQFRTTVHPGFRVPGTLTGRLSGVEPNIQQVPKSRRFLQCLRARPGHVWIDADFTALEPVVLTELSGDPRLLEVFGSEAIPGADIYLHTGLGFDDYRQRIIDAGYDPENPSAEGAARAKKILKRERSDVMKPFYLSSIYGAGAGKKYKTLRKNGVQIEFETVREMNDGFWEYYAGIKQYERRLREEHRQNKGWVFNGIGRPIGVHQDADSKFDKRKDIVNRVVQSTGHDILVQYVRVLSTLLDEAGLNWKPVIIDFHDECIIEVPEGESERTVNVFREAQDRLNKQLGGSIPLKINPVVVRTLADAKLED